MLKALIEEAKNAGLGELDRLRSEFPPNGGGLVIFHFFAPLMYEGNGPIYLREVPNVKYATGLC